LIKNLSNKHVGAHTEVNIIFDPNITEPVNLGDQNLKLVATLSDSADRGRSIIQVTTTH
jgi:hypothetical protein